jgi:hypothetical protein
MGVRGERAESLPCQNLNNCGCPSLSLVRFRANSFALRPSAKLPPHHVLRAHVRCPERVVTPTQTCVSPSTVCPHKTQGLVPSRASVRETCTDMGMQFRILVITGGKPLEWHFKFCGHKKQKAFHIGA